MDPAREDDGLYDIEALQHRVREVMAANDVAMNLELRGRSPLGEEAAPPRLGNGHD